MTEVQGGLLRLPPEILDEIVVHLDSPGPLVSLSSCCSKLKSYVDRYGYRAFVQANFPSYDLPPLWRDATKSLTGLARCWDSRSFLIRPVEVCGAISTIDLPSRTNNNNNKREHVTQPSSQSMGYRTVLECKEEWDGGDWRSRKEFLFIGAGSELRLRERHMGPQVEQSYLEAPQSSRDEFYNHFRHRVNWTILRDDEHKDGPCDITSIHSIPNQEKDDGRTVILSRACGDIERVVLSNNTAKKSLLHHGASQTRCADLSSSADPILAASNSPSSVSLIRTSNPNALSSLLDEMSFASEGARCLIWSCRFLEPERLILGRESKSSPLSVYQATPHGFHHEPIWTLRANENLTCAKTIAPLRDPRAGGGVDSNLFLSGWRSSDLLLHDIRSPRVVCSYFDPVDQTSSTYSLLPFGLHKFVVGSDRHGSIKFFDLRMGKRYHSELSVQQDVQQSPRRSQDSGTIENAPTPASELNKHQGFDLFFSEHISRRGHFANIRRPRRHIQLKDSPVYHLAASSPYASSFYAGVVGATLQIDLVSATDRWPDGAFPMFTGDKTQKPHWANPKKWLDPKAEALGLMLCEHANIKQYAQLNLAHAGFAQGGGALGRSRAGGSTRYLDQRWLSL